MSDVLDLLYRYRLAVAKCAAGGTLNMEEIQLFAGAEQWLGGSELAVRTLLRGSGVNHWVDVHDVTTERLLCRGCPPVEEGERLDLVLDDQARHLSYRFKARVTWAAITETQGIELELSLEGAPLLVRKNPNGERFPEVVERFAA